MLVPKKRPAAVSRWPPIQAKRIMQIYCALVEKKRKVVKVEPELSYKKKAARPRRPAKLAPEATILGAAPSKGVTGEAADPEPLGAAVPIGAVGPAGTVEFP